MRISDWSSDVCSSDLGTDQWEGHAPRAELVGDRQGSAIAGGEQGTVALAGVEIRADHMDHPLRRQPAAGGPARITGAQSVGEEFLAIAQDICPAGCVDRPVDATAATHTRAEGGRGGEEGGRTE